MNQWKKALALAAASVLMVGTLAACGADGEGSGTGSDNSLVSGETKLQLIEDGKLVMGTNAEFAPFEYMEGDAVVGIDAEIMEAVADKLGLTLEIKNMAFDTLDGTLKANQIDVIAAGYTVDPDREENMDFTQTYYTAKQTIIVRADSTAQAKADLEDKKIAVQTGTTGEKMAKALTDEANVSKQANASVAVEMLINGNVDAVIIDNIPADVLKEKHGDKIKLIEDQFEDELYAFAVQKGNETLLKAMNDAIKALQDDGTIDGILKKYITE